MAKSKRLVVLSVRLEPTLKTALDKAAKADARTMSSLVQKVLTEHARKEGFLK
jgi:hypothetical protein